MANLPTINCALLLHVWFVTLNCKLEAKKRTYQCFSNTDGVGKGHDCLLFFTSHPDAFRPCRRFSDVVVNPRVECPGEISLIHPAFSAVLRPSIDRCTRFFSHFQENHFQMLSINTYFIGTKSESQGMKWPATACFVPLSEMKVLSWYFVSFIFYKHKEIRTNCSILQY